MHPTAAVAILAAASPTTFEVWSELVLPTLVGAGSIFIAAVAVAVASRSNRLARAATKAALRSNAIADRANRLEENRDRRERVADEQAERQAFADRWSSVIDQMQNEINSHPTWAQDPQPWAAFGLAGRLRVEASVRGLNFPADAVWKVMMRGAEAAQGPTVVGQAVAAAHALGSSWVQDPGDVENAILTSEQWLRLRIGENLEETTQAQDQA